MSGLGEKRPRTVILHDALPAAARPDEQDTLVQVHAVQDALQATGYAVQTLPLAADLDQTIAALRGCAADVVFNLVESVNGEGKLIHAIPALLEALHLRYTGCGSAALLLSSDKLLTKHLLVASGIATPQWAEIGDLSLPRKLAGPLIVKSVWEDASLGLDADSVSQDAAGAAAQARARQRRFGGDWFAERYVDGREFNVSILGAHAEPEVLPIAEILFVDYPAHTPRIVDYAAKWDCRSFAYTHTVRRFDFPSGDRWLIERLGQVALKCWSAFKLNGYARVDFRVDDQGEPWVLEVNANPCLAPDAGFVAAAAEHGIVLEEIVRRVLQACGAPLPRRTAAA